MVSGKGEPALRHADADEMVVIGDARIGTISLFRLYGTQPKTPSSSNLPARYADSDLRGFEYRISLRSPARDEGRTRFLQAPAAAPLLHDRTNQKSSSPHRH